jgi:hypothetical protein
MSGVNRVAISRVSFGLSRIRCYFVGCTLDDSQNPHCRRCRAKFHGFAYRRFGILNLTFDYLTRPFATRRCAQCGHRISRLRFRRLLIGFREFCSSDCRDDWLA